MKRLLPFVATAVCAGCSVDLLGDDNWCSGPPSFGASALVQMVVGDSTRLIVQRPGVDASTGNCGLVFPPAYEFVWRSTAPTIASVDSYGVVRAFAPGETAISVTPQGSGSEVAQLRVAVRIP